MDLALLNDAARCLHLLGLAFGLGFAIRADHIALGFLFHPLDKSDVRALRSCHLIVSFGLSLFWVSGLVLLWLRTGFVPGEFSPKLVMKIGVVFLLTANAVLIGRYAMPIVESWHHKRLGKIPVKERTCLALLGGVSAASWASALTLGVFSSMKVMDPIRMYEIIGAIYALGIVGALTIVGVSPIAAFLFGPQVRVVSRNATEYRLQTLQPAT